MKKLVLALLVAGTLTACGGGSGKAGPDMAFVFDGEKPFTNHAAAKDYSMDHLVINGKRFDLNKDVAKFKGESAKKYLIGDGKDTVVSKKDWLQHVRIGDIHDDLFYIGYTTPEKAIPTKGKALYKGMSTESQNWEEGQFEIFHIKIDVDFADKKMEGRYLKDDGVTDNGFMFDANIKGAYFEGEDARGMFFGPDADEIGGVTDNVDKEGKRWTGFFGAKKQ